MDTEQGGLIRLGIRLCGRMKIGVAMTAASYAIRAT